MKIFFDVLATPIALVWILALSGGLVGSTLITIFKVSDRAFKMINALVRIHQELWLFAAPGIVYLLAKHWMERDYFDTFFSAVNVFNWWHFRNWPDDDNRWNKRRKKLQSKVKEMSGRLIVVPGEA